MKKHLTTILSSAFILFALVITACNKSSNDDSTLAGIYSDGAVGAVTTTTAQVYSIIGSNGTTPTATGVCWSSTAQAPTISNSKTTNSIDSVSFVSTMSGLTANTTYYVRGYITNSAGTAYGNTVTFKTNSATFATTATVSTFAGSGTGGLLNGLGAAAQLNNPQGICFDAQGNMYVADSFNSVIRKITPTGTVSTYAGTGASGYTDGPAASAQFYAPKGVAADALGNIYVADMGNNMIRKISISGIVSTLAGRYTPGYVDATGTSAAFKSPADVAVDASGNVYVADKGNNIIRAITATGVVTTLAGNTAQGEVDATGTAAYFNAPNSISIDASGVLYVVDANNFSLRKVTTAGVVTSILGNYYLKGVVFSPVSARSDSKGNIFIADVTSRILEITTGNILLPLAGSATSTGFANGTNTSALFNSPQGIAVDAQGNVYIADYYNNMIRKMTVTTTP
jgi:sugar lactone lactonase YvrE